MKEFALIIKLGVAILLISLFGDLVPEDVQRGFFTISLIIKDTLVFCMPLIVFAFIVACLAAFQKKAPLLITLILGFVVASNFFFIQMGYVVGEVALPLLGYTTDTARQHMNQLTPLRPFFAFPFPKLMNTDTALLLGSLVGIYGAFWGNETLTSWSHALKNKVQWALTKVFIPVVPLYVIGFLFKIHHDESLSDLFANYGPIFLLVTALQVLSIFAFFFTANGGNMQKLKASFKNVLPSGLVGLSTMSSVATLPLTLLAAEKNTNNKAVAEVVIPATTNIHHVGNSVEVPILMAAVYAMNGIDPMGYSTYLLFSFYYVIAKFGAASVPGGEAFILIPILEHHFGFSDAMSGLLMTLYIFSDPFSTATNVMCNGALAMLMDKFCGRLKAFRHVEKVTS